MQRIADARFCTGWIIRVEPTQFAAKISNGDAAWLNSEFRVEIQGREAVAEFSASMIAFDGKVGLFRITSPMLRRTSAEVPRFAVRELKAVLRHLGQEYDAEVMDLSWTGIGVRLDFALPAKDEVEVEIKGLVGNFRVKATVQYCRSCSATGKFRLGMKLAPLDRIEKGRWHQLVACEAA